MEYKKYTKEEFDKWCEDNSFDDNINVFGFIKEQEISLEIIEKDDKDTSKLNGTLQIRIKLHEC